MRPSNKTLLKKRRRARRQLKLLLVLAAAAGAGTVLVLTEAESSLLQAQLLSRYASTLEYSLQPGAADAVTPAPEGPFDQRLGYTRLPILLALLESKGMEIEAQAQASQALLNYTGRGLFPPYAEKSQAGLSIFDCRAEAMYGFSYPQRGYASFESIPPLIVQALLFIENRELLKDQHPHLNPAVDWSRFSMAVFFQLAEEIGLEQDRMGGSTLATQIEKYRHSPEGITGSGQEKLRQMVSASVRTYKQGPQTLTARRALALEYMNTVPLSAAPGHGEVHGLGDGLRVWFGADFATVNVLLSMPPDSAETLTEQGLALRQVIALMIAHRRPSYYLAAGRGELSELTDSYLRVMTNAGAISPELRDAALEQPLVFRDFREQPVVVPLPANKGVNAARTRLASLLELPLYELDRLDLSATSTLQRDLQSEVSAYLGRLREPEFAKSIGLVGERLLRPEQAGEVRYSFTLFERTPDGNRVRVQTDNTDQPFDINEGSKLELGSTAKLRVLATYLEVIAELHARYAGLEPKALAEVEPPANDALARWVVGHLRSGGDTSLAGTLDAALNRRYSASPRESFFTGGGLHTFGNFRKEDNNRVATVGESLRESLNLPFVRMMQDLVRHTTYTALGDRDQLLGDDKDPRRQEYLRRFADREGLLFLGRFWRKYQDKDIDARLELFLEGMRPTPARLAVVHRYLFPKADQAAFAAFLRERLPNEPFTEEHLARLYRQYGPDSYQLPDQGYIARIHPLELWLLGYLQQQPQAKFAEIADASEQVRQEVYGWLLRTRAKNARDSRIRTMLEVEAFSHLHQRWKRLGYPFDHLVPSLATALGSSGDRPAALAELMGIILNDGVRQPSIRIDRLHFAAGTPYEAQLRRLPAEGERVMQPEVAAALRSALAEVVDNGTARRLHGSFTLSDGGVLQLGGKTGTGDNRIVSVGANRQRTNGRALNRTATFVFYLGPNHFGTLTAFVSGRAAEAFSFTSALPVQVLKGMAPILAPHLEAGESACRDASYLRAALGPSPEDAAKAH